MGETMVERCAEAVLNARGAKKGAPPIKGLKHLVPRHIWEEATDIARAVIEAMREPTIEMEVAGTEQWLCEAAMEDRSGTNWRAMIDQALADSQG